MPENILDRILRESDAPDLFNILAERLNPSDLQSLLLEVYRVRAVRQTPASLLAQYTLNRFVRPSRMSSRTILESDRLAFSLAAPLFDPIELAPVCPLGATSVVATVDQNSTIATVRNTELVSDSTNVMALECAVRRRVLLQSPARVRERVRLCASHRLLRAQHYDRPDALAHFRLFALCTAGRDEGGYRFELETLSEHLGFYLRFLQALIERGYRMRDLRVGITDFADGAHHESLRTAVIEPLAAQFPNAALVFDPSRSTGRGYYDDVCFYVYAQDHTGIEHVVADGGVIDWTQQLLSNKKERLLISGIGTERVCSIFGEEQIP
jgi:hypothetical protein